MQSAALMVNTTKLASCTGRTLREGAVTARMGQEGVFWACMTPFPRCRVPDAKTEEVKRREAVRAQLAEITEAYKQAQAKTRTALKQFK